MAVEKLLVNLIKTQINTHLLTEYSMSFARKNEHDVCKIDTNMKGLHCESLVINSFMLKSFQGYCLTKSIFLVYLCRINNSFINKHVLNYNLMKHQVFGQRLKNARLLREMTQDEVVAALGETLSKNALSRYERGEMMPRYPILMALARLFDLQLEYFFRPFTVEVSRFELRTKRELTQNQHERLKLKVSAVMERYLETEQLLGLEQRFDNPLQDFPAVTTADDIEQAAQELRQAWQLGAHGLLNLYGLLEHQGIRVIEITDSEDFDGMALVINQHIPVVVVNTAMTVERKRFTVIHELGHLLLRFDIANDPGLVERLCNRFAGAVLLPAPLLKTLMGAPREQIGLHELLLIKNNYGISLQALVYRAVKLGYISQASVDRFRDFIKANMKEENLGNYYGQEVPDRMTQLVARAYHSHRITRSKAAELLGVEERTLPETIDKVW